MPTTNVIPTPQTLPEGFCPTTWQDTLDAFAAGMRVTLPTDYGQIIISQTTPGSGEHGKIWFKTDAGGHILGIYSWDTVSGAWELADPVPYYFIDTGSDSSVVINTGESIPSASNLTGRLFAIKIAETNTSSTITLKVDSLPAKDVFVNGTAVPSKASVQKDMICLFIYDGTDFQLLNPSPNSTGLKQFLSAKSGELTIPATGATAQFAHGFGVSPFMVRAVLIKKSSGTLTLTYENSGGTVEIKQNDEVDVMKFWNTERGAENEFFTPVFGVFCDSTNVNVNAWYPWGIAWQTEKLQNNTPSGGNEVPTTITPEDWKLKIYCLALNPDYTG